MQLRIYFFSGPDTDWRSTWSVKTEQDGDIAANEANNSKTGTATAKLWIQELLPLVSEHCAVYAFNVSREAYSNSEDRLSVAKVFSKHLSDTDLRHHAPILLVGHGLEIYLVKKVGSQHLMNLAAADPRT